MKQVYVLRHASKDAEGNLTEEGKEKAKELQSDLPKFKIVIASESPRTQETAVLLTSVQPTIDKRAGFFNAPKEISDEINRQAATNPAGFTGAYLANNEIKEDVSNQAKQLEELVYETLEKLGSNEKALIISHDITMVPAEKLLTDKHGTESFDYLSGFIVDQDKRYTLYPE